MIAIPGIYQETKTGRSFKAEKPPLSVSWSTYGRKSEKRTMRNPWQFRTRLQYRFIIIT